MRDLLRRILYLARENNALARENNRMLRAITEYLIREAANADNENTQDFGRNVLANLISNMLEGNINFGRR